MTTPAEPAININPWLTAGLTEIVLGIIAISSVLTTTLGDDKQSVSHTAALYLSGLLVVAGLITVAATLVNIGTRRTVADAAADVARELKEYIDAARAADREHFAATAQDLHRSAVDELRKEIKTAVEEVYLDGIVDGGSQSPGASIRPIGGRRPHPSSP